MQLSELRHISPQEFSRRAFKSLGYRKAALESRAWEHRFTKASPAEYRKEPCGRALPGLRVFSLAGAAQFPLQVLSILSFLRHAGTPERWLVSSDGSLTKEQERHLRELHPSIEVQPWENCLNDRNRAATGLYAERGPMGKKLAIETAMPAEGWSIYADTDVLFFAGAHRLQELFAREPDNYFVRDCGNAVVEGLATSADRDQVPVNAGFLIQGRPVPWDAPLARLLHCLETDWPRYKRYRHFLEQTTVHLAYHACGAKVLDPAYVIDLTDGFEAKDRFCGPDVVMRHYLCETRYKLWLHARDYLR